MNLVLVRPQASSRRHCSPGLHSLCTGRCPRHRRRIHSTSPIHPYARVDSRLLHSPATRSSRLTRVPLAKSGFGSASMARRTSSTGNGAHDLLAAAQWTAGDARLSLWRRDRAAATDAGRVVVERGRHRAGHLPSRPATGARRHSHARRVRSGARARIAHVDHVYVVGEPEPLSWNYGALHPGVAAEAAPTLTATAFTKGASRSRRSTRDR